MPQHLEIALDLLNEPPQPIRAGMDEDKLHELAVSIRKYGVLQNLVVIPDDVRFEVVAGHRRMLAARLAGLTHVPCRVYENLEDAKFGAMLDENTMREDLTAAEEGMQFLDLVEKRGWSVPQLQVQFGRSEEYINARVRLVVEFPEVMKHVAAREMNFSQAQAIMRCPDKKWQAYLIEQATVHGATARALRQYVDQFKGINLASIGMPAPNTPSHAPILLEQTKVRCLWCQRDDDQDNMTTAAIHSYHVRDLTEFLRATGIGSRFPSSPSSDRGAA